jgi:hypothetical protein
MAQQGRVKSAKQLRSKPGQPQHGGASAQRQHGSSGNRGRGGEQYQQKDMGAHPAYGKSVKDPDGRDEDYGNRGLHRHAGTTKVEGQEDRNAVEEGGIAKDQDVRERDAIERRDPMAGARDSSQGFDEVEEKNENGGGDQSQGSGKRSRRNPAKR